MTLDDLLDRHARGILTDSRYVGEVVTLRRAGAPDRQVRAVVDRLGRQRDVDERLLSTSRAILFLPRDEAVGLGVHQVGDEIVMAMAAGATPVRARIVNVEAADAGGLRVEVIA